MMLESPGRVRVLSELVPLQNAAPAASTNTPTLFPHNIGLGAMCDPALMRRIGEVTATEMRLAWLGGPSGSFALASTKIMDLSRESNGAFAIEIDMRVDRLDAHPLLLRMGCGAYCGAQVDIFPAVRSFIGKGWQTLSVPLSCFAKAGVGRNALQNLIGPSAFGATGQLCH
jgi:Galactose-binding domain-like